MNAKEKKGKREQGLKSSHTDRMKQVHDEMQEKYKNLYLGLRKVQRLDETFIEMDAKRNKETIEENCYLKGEAGDLQKLRITVEQMQITINTLKGQLSAEKGNWVFEKQNK